MVSNISLRNYSYRRRSFLRSTPPEGGLITGSLRLPRQPTRPERVIRSVEGESTETGPRRLIEVILFILFIGPIGLGPEDVVVHNPITIGSAMGGLGSRNVTGLSLFV
jgi:hypothetical protein